MSINARETVLVFTDSGGTLRTLQCDFNDVSYRSTRPVASTETFCATEKSPGNLDITIDVAGLYNDTTNRVDQVFDGLKRDTTARLYKYGPAGSGTGEVMYSGLSYLIDYEIGASAGGQVEVTASFAVTGDDVRTTWP